jgi:beta-lactam-binding protein with PASTA domain
VGSLTFKNLPDRLYLLNTSTLGLQYARDIPAKGSVQLSFSYSRTTSQAQVAQFAAAAEAALTPPPCVVPRTLGMTVAAARATLHAAHCVIGKVAHETSKSTPSGQVKSQRPKTGSVLPSNAKVSLVVSLGRSK